MTKEKTKNAAIKKVVAKKSAAKVPAKKATEKAIQAKKVPEQAAKKATAKKVAAKKDVTKKAPAKVGASGQEPVVAKQAPAKATAQTSSAKKRVTTVIAEVDAGFGNSVHLRGTGPGLSWEEGVPMENVSPTEWVWRNDSVSQEVEFKVLLNDTHWSAGVNGTVAPGGTVVVSPRFE